jgi:hypothetical protein
MCTLCFFAILGLFLNQPDAGISAQPQAFHPVSSLILGVNQAFQTGEWTFEDPQLSRAFAITGVKAVRFPAGTNGSFWDWKDSQYVEDDLLLSIGPPSWYERHSRQKAKVATRPMGTFGVDRYAAMCERLGVEPEWCPNFVTRTPEYAAEMFEFLHEKGLPVRYVELGNEYSGGAFKRQFPSGASYMQAATGLVDVIRQLYPQVQIGAVAHGGHLFSVDDRDEESGSGGVRGDTWNDQLLDYRSFYDAWIVHGYLADPAQLRKQSPDRFPDALLAMPQVAMSRAADYSRTHLGGLPLWLTEYNIAYHRLLGETPSIPLLDDEVESFIRATKNSRMQALHIAGYLFSAASDADIWKMANYHSFTGMPGFGMVQISEESLMMNPVALLFHRIEPIASSAEQCAGLNFAGQPNLGLTIGGTVPDALQGVVWETASGQRTVTVINRSAHPVPVKLPWLVRDTVAISFLPADADPKEVWVNVPADDSLDVTTLWPGCQKEKKGADSRGLLDVVFPPYSLTIVENEGAN